MNKLLEFLRRTETGQTDPVVQYNTIIGHKEGKLPKPLTQFTVAELLAAQPTWPRLFNVKSGAAGAYQIINSTLKGLMTAGVVRPSDPFNRTTQDKLGAQLVRERGYERFISGALSLTEFGNNLAKEWASMPCLSPIKRGAIALKRGQSYYDKIAGNSALVKPEALEAVLRATYADAHPAVSQSKETTVATEVVKVKSSWVSKINWTMAIGVVFNTFALFGLDVPDDVRTQIMGLGSSALFVLGWVLKTFFTTTITPASVKKL